MVDFDEIYARYFSRVYKFVMGLCRDPSLAEEITQEAFFKTLKSVDKFNGECDIGTWLCKIAKNTFYDYVKRNKRRGGNLPEDLASDENIEERFADRETAYVAYKILHGMSEPYREVFWLRTFGELSYLRGAVFRADRRTVR